jgi:hypothetical protein
MFGTDEFGNTRLLAITFVLVFAALAVGTVGTSQTMWGGSEPTAVQMRY